MPDQASNPLAFLRERECSIFVGPRPGKKSVRGLSELDLTHCCTLLSRREQVESVRRLCETIGCQWIWLPIEGGKLEVLRQIDLAGLMRVLAREIGDEPRPRVYFHCSAGIHRTGFFVYAMLRMRGLDRDRAREELSRLRAVTAQQVGEDRLDLADEMLADAALV